MRTFVECDGFRTAFRCEPGEEDGVPVVPSVRMEARLRHQNRDRLAVASALLFIRHTGGMLAPAKGCGPGVAAGLTRLWAPRELVVAAVHAKPEPIPTGSRTVILSDETWRTMACLARHPSAMLVRLATDQSSDGYFSLRELRLASNVKLLMDGLAEVDTLFLLPLVVALAEDHDIRTIVLPMTEPARRPDIDLGALRALGRQVNLEITAPLLGADLETAVRSAGTLDRMAAFYREFRPDRRSLDDYPEWRAAAALHRRAHEPRRRRAARPRPARPVAG